MGASLRFSRRFRVCFLLDFRFGITLDFGRQFSIKDCYMLQVSLSLALHTGVLVSRLEVVTFVESFFQPSMLGLVNA